MTEFLGDLSLFPLVLTMGAFQIGLWCQKKWHSPVFNPILIAVILVICILLLTGFPVEDYQAGTNCITWLLTPATVCLALPLYKQLKVLRKSLPAILTGVVAGTVSALISIIVLCRLFQLDTAISISLLPKSITTAMGLVLSGQNGGIPALTTIAIMVTGILGSLTGSILCKLLKLQDPITQGVALGTASHVVGTTKANELGHLQGAVSSLSLVIAGILTAILFPMACIFL
jgi:predicted murein hydrolase (TIGR00659 family)